jgi:hypothetical protein
MKLTLANNRQGVNMSQMYLVTASRGSHDNREDWVEVCSTNRPKLETWIAERKVENAAEQAFQIKLADLYEQFRNDNPIPVPTTLHKQEIPRWAPGLGKAQITENMQQERQAAIDNNRLLNEVANQLQDDWVQNKWFPTYRQFLVDQGRVPKEQLWLHETLGSRYWDEIYFSIQEIEQI